jgi:hypothetical protein
MAKGRPEKIDMNKTVALLDKGVPVTDIARVNNVTPESMFRFIKRHELPKLKETINYYKDNRISILREEQILSILMKNMIMRSYLEPDAPDIPETIKVMPPSAKTGMMHACTNSEGVAIDKEQSLSGMPTSIVAYVDLLKAKKEKLAEMNNLRDKLDEIESASCVE